MGHEIRSQEVEFDVVIAGAGITGVTTALMLQERGLKCAIAEARNMGFGTTGGTTAHLNNFFDASYDKVINDFGLDKARLLADAARDALEIIRHNVSAYDIECDHEPRSAYLFSLDDEQEKELDSLVEGSRKAGIEMHEVAENPFGIPCTKVVEIPGQAQFHPLKYVKGLLTEFIHSGGMIIEGCRVTEAVKEGEGLKISTTRGTLHGKHLIYATHIPPGRNIMHFRNAPYRSYAMALKLRNGAYPRTLGYDMLEAYHYYRTHEVDGEEYLIVGGEDHKTGDVENSDECFQRLEEYVSRYFDIERVAYKWSSQYYEPADGLPYIGPLPGNPSNVYCATGYSGNGMIFGTLAAKTLSGLIADGDSPYKELFSPSRVKPVAAFSQMVKENVDVIKHLVVDSFTVEKLNALADLERDEGKVVSYDGNQLAMYKDVHGKTHILESKCTHLYCTLVWNHEEKSWDCPCHGSRFGIDGDVLTAPAVKGLKNLAAKQEDEPLD